MLSFWLPGSRGQLLRDTCWAFNMVTICQTCGDRGFSNALIFCHACHDYAVHRYCLRKLPATFDEYVVWLCEDCELKIEKASFHDKLSPFQAGENDSESFESVQVKKRNLVKKKLKKNSKRKVSTCSLTKSKFLNHRKSSSSQLLLLEVRCSENSEKDQEFVRQNGLNECSSNEVVESIERRNSQLGLPEQTQMICCEDKRKYEKCGKQVLLDEGNLSERAECLKTKSSLAAIPLEVNFSEDQKKDQNFGRQKIPVKGCFYEENERLYGSNKNSFSEEGKSPKTKNTQLVRCDVHPLEIDCTVDVEEDKMLGRQNDLDEGSLLEVAEPCETRNSQLVISYNPKIVEKSLIHAQPIIDPIWRGSFSILDKNFSTVGGLVAHVSSLACPKVSEEAKSLETLISSELLPRSTIWPKGFKKSGPSHDSIALYFFPDSERNEKVFDSLVDDMINKDLAMRAVLKNAELLIFTSTVLLPMEFWRFQAKFYLWGVFKEKQSSRVVVDAVPGDEKDLTKALTWGGQSPVSPLSNGSYSCGSMYSTLNQSMS